MDPFNQHFQCLSSQFLSSLGENWDLRLLREVELTGSARPKQITPATKGLPLPVRGPFILMLGFRYASMRWGERGVVYCLKNRYLLQYTELSIAAFQLFLLIDLKLVSDRIWLWATTSYQKQNTLIGLRTLLREGNKNTWNVESFHRGKNTLSGETFGEF